MKRWRHTILVVFTGILSLILLSSCSDSGAEFRAAPAATSAENPLRPAAPAAIDEGFRADPVAVVANTGKPQLLEFFAYW